MLAKMGMEGNVLANVIWDKHASPTNYGDAQQ